MAECVPSPEPAEISPDQYDDQEDYDETQLEEEEEEDSVAMMISKLKEHSKYVKLNVGGALFTTTLRTLLKEDNMLRAMFSGRMEVQTDDEGKKLPIGRPRLLRHAHLIRLGFDRSKWETFWIDIEFLEGWLRLFTWIEERVYGTARWVKVMSVSKR